MKFSLTKNNQSGFTLMEVMVAVTIFIFLLTMITDTFMVLEGRKNRLAQRYDLITDAKLMTQKISQDLRLLTLDYSGSDWPAAVSTNELRLTDANGQHKIVYKFGDFGNCLNCLGVQYDGAGDWSVLNKSTISLTGSHFYVWPTSDPFTPDANGAYAVNNQPRATIVLKLALPDSPPEEILTTQTTVVSRLYQR